MSEKENAEEEKKLQLQEEEENRKVYEAVVKKLEQKGLKSVEAYKNILTSSDDDNNKSATEEIIQKEVDLLIGEAKEWSTGTFEVKQFRENIKKIKSGRTKITETKEKKLPPSYTASGPVPSEMATKPFICKVILRTKTSTMTKALVCDTKASASEFATIALNKIEQSIGLTKSVDDWVFKATGAAEFVYGGVKMLDFEYVRKCLKQGKQPELTLVEKDVVLEETDQTANELKTIDYDFNFSKDPNRGYDHDKIKFDVNNWENMEVISLWDLNRPLKVRVSGIDNIEINEAIKKLGDANDLGVYVCIEITYGGKNLCKPRYTRCEGFSKDPRFNQTLEFSDLLMCNMPREARLCFTAYTRPFTKEDLTQTECVPGKKDYPIGWVNLSPFDYKYQFNSGKHSMRMWPDNKAKPTGSFSEYFPPEGVSPILLQVELEAYSVPVVFPSTGTIPDRIVKEQEDYENEMKKKYKNQKPAKKLEEIYSQDPLYQLNEEEKWQMWEAKETIKNIPKALPKFLLSVNYKNPYAIRRAHELLKEWKPIAPLDALELLNMNFADERVRRYAVECINALDDNELYEFVLQLVQTLKFEPYHDCSLTRFLLQRALRSTHLIGHILFWHLKAEMHVPEIHERYGLLLEEYLHTCGGHRRELLKQNGVIDQLLGVAMTIKKYKHDKKDKQLSVLKEELAKVTLPPKFKLPLNPRMECKGIKIEKCKVMDSAKLPLWLVFINVDESGNDIYVIFKAGDDLRQDLLTLQMLRIMDKLWRQHALDLHMQPYGCISTGDGVGMIEVVLNSDTIAHITSEYGGANAVYSKEPIITWLKKHNTEKKTLEQAQINFAYSSAGYCVATYILGIGDRHNDNIMITKKGDLFHIDFGHFLGHFKTFAGMKRETSPFVFTPMYAQVMGGTEAALYKQFLGLACQAYNLVRENGHLMMTLFLLMLETGIPELTEEKDVAWLQTTLKFNLSKDEAAKSFQTLTKQALENKRQLFSDYCHIIAHQ